MKYKSIIQTLSVIGMVSGALAQTTGVIYNVTLAGTATFQDAKKNKTSESSTRMSQTSGVSTVAINNRVVLEEMLNRELLTNSTTIAGWSLVAVESKEEQVSVSSFFYAYKAATKTAAAIAVPVPEDILSAGDEGEIKLNSGTVITISATGAKSGSVSNTSSQGLSLFNFNLAGVIKVVDTYTPFKLSSTATTQYLEVGRGTIDLIGFGTMPTGFEEVNFNGGESAHVTLKATFVGRAANISTFVIPIVQQ